MKDETEEGDDVSSDMERLRLRAIEGDDILKVSVWKRRLGYYAIESSDETVTEYESREKQNCKMGG